MELSEIVTSLIEKTRKFTRKQSTSPEFFDNYYDLLIQLTRSLETLRKNNPSKTNQEILEANVAIQKKGFNINQLFLIDSIHSFLSNIPTDTEPKDYLDKLKSSISAFYDFFMHEVDKDYRIQLSEQREANSSLINDIKTSIQNSHKKQLEDKISLVFTSVITNIGHRLDIADKIHLKHTNSIFNKAINDEQIKNIKKEREYFQELESYIKGKKIKSNEFEEKKNNLNSIYLLTETATVEKDFLKALEFTILPEDSQEHSKFPKLSRAIPVFNNHLNLTLIIDRTLYNPALASHRRFFLKKQFDMAVLILDIAKEDLLVDCKQKLDTILMEAKRALFHKIPLNNMPIKVIVNITNANLNNLPDLSPLLEEYKKTSGIEYQVVSISNKQEVKKILNDMGKNAVDYIFPQKNLSFHPRKR